MSDVSMFPLAACSLPCSALPHHDGMTTNANQASGTLMRPKGSLLSLTYVGVLLFCLVYFFRPEDFISFLQNIPLAKVTGAIAVSSLFLALFSGAVRFCTEIKLMSAFFLWCAATIPFSAWRAGSFSIIVLDLSKMLIVAFAVIASATTWSRLRRLMEIQTLAMLALAYMSFTQDRHGDRMFGVGAMLADPNDLALNLCVVLPFCVAFIFSTDSKILKLFWAVAALTSVAGIVATFSRGGFLALLVVLFTLWRRFCLTPRSMLVVLAGLAIVLTSLVVIAPSSYFDRMQTIIHVDNDQEGSAQQRRGLLITSLEQTVAHPLTGVGPGEFAQVSGTWLQTHNTYTQLSAEMGIPALLLFLALLRHTFKNLRSASQREPGTQAWYVAGALYCGMWGYVVGAFFLPTAYWFLPYLLMAYAATLKHVFCCPPNATSAAQTATASA